MGKHTSRKPKRAAAHRCLCCGHPLKRKAAIDAGVGPACALRLLAVRR